MSELVIEIDSELEQRLNEAASRDGLSLAEFVRQTLHTVVTPQAAVAAPFASLPRKTPEDARAMALRQGVKPLERPEDLAGDFWPEDEGPDDFLNALREWRSLQAIVRR